MTNEMKLLMELCDALGFKVKTNLDRKETKITKHELSSINRGWPHNSRWRIKGLGSTQLMDIDENGMYTKFLIEPEVSYTLTKRNLL